MGQLDKLWFLGRRKFLDKEPLEAVQAIQPEQSPAVASRAIRKAGSGWPGGSPSPSYQGVALIRLEPGSWIIEGSAYFDNAAGAERDYEARLVIYELSGATPTQVAFGSVRGGANVRGVVPLRWIGSVKRGPIATFPAVELQVRVSSVGGTQNLPNWELVAMPFDLTLIDT